jgi:hypothetical protein
LAIFGSNYLPTFFRLSSDHLVSMKKGPFGGNGVFKNSLGKVKYLSPCRYGCRGCRLRHPMTAIHAFAATQPIPKQCNSTYRMGFRNPFFTFTGCRANFWNLFLHPATCRANFPNPFFTFTGCRAKFPILKYPIAACKVAFPIRFWLLQLVKWLFRFRIVTSHAVKWVFRFDFGSRRL